jgi:hypothetical protein
MKKLTLWQKIAIVTTLVCAVGLVVRSRQSPPQPKPYRFPTPELAALDWVVQERFAINPTNNFGAVRIGNRHEYFQAESARESAAVEGLEAARQQVLFYVVGRHILLNTYDGMGRVPVQGPIFMTHGRVHAVKADQIGGPSGAVKFHSVEALPGDAPSEGELKALAKEVFSNYEHSRGISSKTGSWHVEAVPVPASDIHCVNCHNAYPQGWHSVRLGDTLGVALYCYRPETGP